MAKGPGLRLRGDLRQTLGAGMHQGIEILALPMLDLHAEVERQAAENPFLIVEAARPSHLSDGFEAASRTLAAPTSLMAHLHGQIAVMDLPESIRAIARYLAADLDERGYLPASDAQIATECGSDHATVAAARAALQACDPVGVGALGLADSLRLQLIDDGIAPDLAAGLCAHLSLIAAGEHAAAARLLSLPLAEMRAHADHIARLSPDPAAAFAPRDAAPLIPEMEIRRDSAGQIEVALIDDLAPAIRFDAALDAATRGSSDASARAFVTAQRAAARHLIGAVTFRSRTLLSIGQALAEAQSAFLSGHAPAPAPLNRAAIADTLGLHASTVGRAIRGRGVLFDGQVRPLAWFFPSAVPSGDGEAVSSADVQARIRRLLTQETPNAVLSDAQIVAHLADEGVDIARRTVAKYRQCLAIPTSAQRKRLLARRARSSESMPLVERTEMVNNKTKNTTGG